MDQSEIKKEIQKLIYNMNFPARAPRLIWVWAHNEEGGHWAYEPRK